MRRGARARPGRDRPRPGDRPHASDARPLSRAVRRANRRSPLCAHGRRASRRARADLDRGRASGSRRTLGGLRARRKSRAHLHRRGARRVVQAGIRSAVRRPHGRGEASLARRRRRGLRKRDAEGGELGAARTAGARRPRRRASTARQDRRPSTRAGIPALGAAARGARRDRRPGRQGDPAPEPPRRRAGAPLPRVRKDDPLRQLRSLARPTRRRFSPLSPLRLERARSRHLPRVRFERARAARRGDAAARA